MVSLKGEASLLLSGGSVITKVRSPRAIGGLINGRTYSFSMNGRKDGGPGGPATPTVVAVPTLAGASWAVGEPLGSGKLTGISTGNSAAGYASIAVGAAGTIYASVNSGATTTPANPAAPADLNAVWYGTIGFVLVFAVIAAVIAAAYPAVKASRMNVLDAIATE